MAWLQWLFGGGGDYYYDVNAHQFDISASGGMIGHQHGLTLGPEINGSTALIELPGFSGVPVQNAPWVKTDFRGYGIMPGLVPYQEQEISLDSGELPPDIEINEHPSFCMTLLFSFSSNSRMR